MLAPASHTPLDRLARQQGENLSLADLVGAGLDQIAFPGSGATLQRWRRLAEVAALDLSLVKLYEGHTDALAILNELRGAPAPAGSRWGTWCSEPPSARLAFTPLDRLEPGARVRVSGTKAWCSGADQVTHAVVSGWAPDATQWLIAIEMDQSSIEVTDQGWQAVGMRDSASVDVRFDAADAVLLGAAGQYTSRAGFWQGGAGIAACWFGGARGIAEQVREGTTPKSDAHRLAHLGAIDVASTAAAAALREAASWIDAHPQANAMSVAMRARLIVEHACAEVLAHAGRAAGAGPLCRDRSFARAMADLPVYLRQSHAERDLAALGEVVSKEASNPWML
ncbi:acyl-CoA dehydrogenase family protein [soil metagenome]